MNIEVFKKAGIFFSYCRYAVFPQIPYTQDVLFVLQLTDKKHEKGYYGPEGAANWASYIENVVLVAAAVASQVLGMERYDEAEARKIIAQAIIELCPAEAKCLFVSAFVAAKEIAGQEVPPKTADRETLLVSCGCAGCKEVIRERGYAYA